MLFNKEISTEQFKEFISLLTFLKPWEVIGVARILGVEILTDELDEKNHHLPREFSEVYSDMLDAFCALGRKERKEIIIILRNAKEQQKNDDSEN